MGVLLNGLFAMAVGSFISYGALRALAGLAVEVSRSRRLRSRGRTAMAIVASVGEPDPDDGSRRATVRFASESGRNVEGAVHLHRKRHAALAAGEAVQIRYDPADPQIFAHEAGRRQGFAEMRQAVVVAVLMLVFVLPTSVYLVVAGLSQVLF